MHIFTWRISRSPPQCLHPFSGFTNNLLLTRPKGNYIFQSTVHLYADGRLSIQRSASTNMTNILRFSELSTKILTNHFLHKCPFKFNFVRYIAYQSFTAISPVLLPKLYWKNGQTLIYIKKIVIFRHISCHIMDNFRNRWYLVSWKTWPSIGG